MDGLRMFLGTDAQEAIVNRVDDGGLATCVLGSDDDGPTLCIDVFCTKTHVVFELQTDNLHVRLSGVATKSLQDVPEVYFGNILKGYWPSDVARYLV